MTDARRKLHRWHGWRTARCLRCGMERKLIGTYTRSGAPRYVYTRDGSHPVDRPPPCDRRFDA